MPARESSGGAGAHSAEDWCGGGRLGRCAVGGAWARLKQVGLSPTHEHGWQDDSEVGHVGWHGGGRGTVCGVGQ